MQQVGEVVVLHLVEHVDDAVEVESLDQAQLFLLGELLEQVGEAVVVHRRRQLAALRQRQRAHDAGDVGGVHVAQAGGLRRGLVRRRPELGYLAPFGEPEVRAPAQRVAAGEPHRGHFPPPDAPVLDLTQADVADRLAAHGAVDDLGRDQLLARAALERVQVDVPAAQPHTVVVDAGDACRVDEDPAALAAGDEPDDPGRGAGTAGHDHDVDDLADLGAAGVEQGQAYHPECVDHLACHAARLSVPPAQRPR